MHLVPPEGPDRCFQQAGCDRGDVSKALPGVFVAEDEMLGRDSLGMLDAPGRPVDQHADLGEADPQQPGAEPLFPGTHNGGDRQCIRLV